MASVASSGPERSRAREKNESSNGGGSNRSKDDRNKVTNADEDDGGDNCTPAQQVFAQGERGGTMKKRTREDAEILFRNVHVQCQEQRHP